jgi:hypothetical protein
LRVHYANPGVTRTDTVGRDLVPQWMPRRVIMFPDGYSCTRVTEKVRRDL